MLLNFGGVRNWDYRCTWLRDAALTIEVMVDHGLTEGASLWRDWLLRAVAGDIHDLRIMYGLGGERDTDEKELAHLAGYEGFRPVRIGNGAADQYQADVPGEVMLALARLRDHGVAEDAYSWGLQRNLLRYCEAHLDSKDHGIWEMRGDLHHFTHGRVMMWAAFNEGVRAVHEHGLEGDAEHWARLRDGLREEILEHGFEPAAAPSPRPTTTPRWTPPCCSCRIPASSPTTTNGCSARSPRSRRTCRSCLASAGSSGTKG